MRWLGAVVLGGILAGGCTSVRMAQRDGCWVRRTEKWPSRVTEEVGPCQRQAPAWVEDRLTRLVQECVAAADYRWHNRSLEAWRAGSPLPEPEANILQACMGEATRVTVTENETLRTRLTEVAADRESLRSTAEGDREHLRSSHDRIASALGEAAKKPAPAAVATATSTSDGSATTEAGSTSQAPSCAAPASVSVPLKSASGSTKVRRSRTVVAAPDCAPDAPDRTPDKGKEEMGQPPAGSPATPVAFPPAPATPNP